jgi:ATP-dependent phosphofructokinase / diphosphate-dependent phosphofructokinase
VIPKDVSVSRIGILTGGGDCPGLNAAIRAVVRKAVGVHGLEVLGFRDGWRGVADGDARVLDVTAVQGILHRGGTILGSSGMNPYREGGIERVRTAFSELGLDGIVAIGGDGTLGVCARLAEEGFPVLGIPKTIDNDLSGTDVCIGFQTAVQVATDAIDRLHTTAESHNRLMLVEVMGRSAGWIALHAGLAGGADAILIPERPFDVREVSEHLRQRHQHGHSFSIVVVAEGAVPVAGTLELPEYARDERGFVRFGGIAHHLAPMLEQLTGYESRVTVLGHVQRGGSPVAEDRVLATRFGEAAVDVAVAGRWGRMVAARGSEIVDVPLADVAKVRPVPEELYRVAEVFFDP